jgi:hypothetical protein
MVVLDHRHSHGSRRQDKHTRDQDYKTQKRQETNSRRQGTVRQKKTNQSRREKPDVESGRIQASVLTHTWTVGTYTPTHT